MNNLEGFEKDIEECQKAFYSGDKIMLLEAIRRCAQYKIPMPYWVRIEFEKAYFLYVKAGVKELGDAFGLAREKGTHINAENKRIAKAFKVWKRMRELHDNNNQSIDEAMYEQVGGEFSIGASTARDYYRDVEKSIKGQK